MSKLRDMESKAKVVWQRADDTNAPDRQELSDKYVASKEARKQGIKRHEDAKKAYAMCCAKRTTADQVADTAQKDTEALIKVWSSVADLGTSRFEAAYCQTRDGRILAFGGENNHCQMQDTCEIYEPANDTWRPLPEGQLLMPLVDHQASLIKNGFQGGFKKFADMNQEAYAAERPPSQQMAFGKASRLQAQFQMELTEDEKARDAKPWSTEEEKRLTQLVKLHPGGTEAEWRTIATDLGTHRSHHAVKTHFGWKEIRGGKKLRGGLDGRGGAKSTGKGKGKAKARSKKKKKKPEDPNEKE
jgi:O6-methylguanine-DNA--protein-cysteine methyltransferase